MAKSFNLGLLRNHLGQTTVEYILLLAVITSLTYTFYNNKRFKNFLAGKEGMFAIMKNGMSYSYRYGLDYKQNVEFDEKMQFEYTSNKHDTYYNSKDNTSRFFAGAVAYPKLP